MKTEIVTDGNRLVAKFYGRLDTAAAVQTAEEVKPLLEAANKEIVLDCSELEYISSSGLRIFLGIRKEAANHGSNVVVRNINADIRQVFCNGKKSWEIYRRYTEAGIGRSAVCLPSTSPANASWSLDRLIDAWREQLVPYL